MIQTAISLLAASAVQAPPAVAIGPVPAPEARRTKPKPTSRWFIRTGIARAHYNSGARITTNGKAIPGSTVDVTDSTTFIVDIGYDLSNELAVMFTGGIPPSADVVGEGSVAPFGKLGHVRFGPAILTAVYRLPAWQGIRPYAGVGAAHLFILKAKDGSVQELEVRDHNGLVAQAGIEYRLNNKWELFADYKHIWLNVHAKGFLAHEPIRAKVTLDPDLLSAGVKFHFG